MSSTASHAPAKCDTKPSSRKLEEPPLSSTGDAVKAIVTFDTAYPFLVLSVGGRMSALTGLGSSRMVGRSVRMFQNLNEDPVDILWAAQAASSGRTVSIQTTMNACGEKVQFLAEFCLDDSAVSGPVLKMSVSENIQPVPSSQPWCRTRSCDAIAAGNLGRNTPDVELLLTAEESSQADFDDVASTFLLESFKAS